MGGNGYDFFLDKCLLPVAPQKLKVKVNGANSTMTLINGGEVNILKTPALTDIEFECCIPQVAYPFAGYRGGFRDAVYFLDTFERLKAGKKPFQFIVSRTMPDGRVLFSTDMKVSLEDYEVTEEAKDGFDVAVKVSLKQYREYGTKTARVVVDGGAVAMQARRAKSTVRPFTPVGIGSEVIVNGRLYRDSYGGGAGRTLTDYRGKVNFVNRKGTHPYHVTSPSGGWLGWVAEGSVRGV